MCFGENEATTQPLTTNLVEHTQPLWWDVVRVFPSLYLCVVITTANNKNNNTVFASNHTENWQVGKLSCTCLHLIQTKHSSSCWLFLL